MQYPYPVDIEKIREIIPESADKLWATIMDMIMLAAELNFEKKIGHINRRIGIFGSHQNGGKETIRTIARTVCKQGYMAITGEGYCSPENCDDWRSTAELFPPLISDVIKKFKIPDFVRFNHFPRLVSRAIVNLNPMGTQKNEAEGCFTFGVPMLGFVINPNIIQDKVDLCSYIENNTVYQECMCPEKELCMYPTVRPKCPFYEPISVSWGVKQLFMTKINRIIAVEDSKRLEVAVIEYLTSKQVKPTFADKT